MAVFGHQLLSLPLHRKNQKTKALPVVTGTPMKTVKVRTPEEQRGESHKELSDMTPQGILIREADRHS